MFNVQRFTGAETGNKQKSDDLLQKLKAKVSSAQPKQLIDASEDTATTKKRKRTDKAAIDGDKKTTAADELKDIEIDYEKISVKDVKLAGELLINSGDAPRPSAPKSAVNTLDGSCTAWKLDETLKQNISLNGRTFFFPIQRRFIPALLSSTRAQDSTVGDFCISAPTGSGKTLAYCIPIIQVSASTIFVVSILIQCARLYLSSQLRPTSTR